MSLQDEIDALPKWPEFPPVAGVVGSNAECRAIGRYHSAAFDAALARLALAREVIRTRVQIRSDEDDDDISALLAAMEPPK